MKTSRKNNFIDYFEALKIVHKLNLKSNTYWRIYCKSGDKPENIPANPDRIYKNKGWTNWENWLGNEIPINKNKNSLNNIDSISRIQTMLNRIRRIVEENQGKLLSDNYKNKISILEFSCKNGHIWKAQAQTILNGSWCRKCWEENEAGNQVRLIDGIIKAKNIAKERLGECLSTEYITGHLKLTWKCNNGHIWDAAYSDIKKGTWCPECGPGIRERLCRHIIQTITGQLFPKKRPKWLINKRGNQMELDGFSENLQIAFEHHGEYHYHLVPHFQRKNEKLEQRKDDDETKSNLCEQNNVNLIIIPYNITIDKLPNFILKNLKKINSNYKYNNYENTLNSYVISNELEELQNLAISKGGKCLSKIYLGVNHKHHFECSKKHQFYSLPSNIKSKRSTWCPSCAPDKIGDSNRKYNIIDMQKIAYQKNGLFLGETFKNVNTKYFWECKNKHQWLAEPMDIIKGGWCRKCSINGKKDTILVMQEIAKAKDGECLSKEYLGQQEKLKWKCKLGHEWYAKPSNVKNRNSWCPKCSRKKIQ